MGMTRGYPLPKSGQAVEPASGTAGLLQILAQVPMPANDNHPRAANDNVRMPKPSMVPPIRRAPVAGALFRAALRLPGAISIVSDLLELAPSIVEPTPWPAQALGPGWRAYWCPAPGGTGTPVFRTTAYPVVPGGSLLNCIGGQAVAGNPTPGVDGGAWWRPSVGNPDRYHHLITFTPPSANPQPWPWPWGVPTVIPPTLPSPQRLPWPIEIPVWGWPDLRVPNWRDIPNRPNDPFPEGTDRGPKPGKPDPQSPNPGKPTPPKPVKPPPPDVKERKFMIAVHPASLLYRAVNAVSESDDAVTALYEALPKRIKRQVYRELGRQPGVHEKVAIVARFIDQVKWDKALVNLVENQFEDWLFGKAGRILKAANRASGRAAGFGLGPAL